MMREEINPNEVFSRISKGKPYGKNLKPYTKNVLVSVVQLLEDIDEFEKCIELNKFIDDRFTHEWCYLIDNIER